MNLSDVHKLFGHFELRFVKAVDPGMFHYGHTAFSREIIGIDIVFSGGDGSATFLDMNLDTILRHHHIHKLTLFNYRNKRISVDVGDEADGNV